MRAHQAASKASSAREKCTRPLVVGPSPVITPSRTTQRASAALSRQEIPEGSSAPIGSASLDRGADIAGSSSRFLGLGQHFHAGVNEWLTNRNWGRDIFRWLLICRGGIGGGSARGAPGPACCGSYKAISKAISGQPGLLAPLWFFCRTGADQKKM